MPENFLKITSKTEIKLILIVSLFMNLLYFFGPSLLIKTNAATCGQYDKESDEYEKCIEKKLNDAQEDYENTSNKLDEIRGKKNSISGRISELSSQLGITQSEINSVQDDIDEVSDELAVIGLKLEETRQKLDDKIKLRNQIVRNYSKKTILNDLEIFFASVNVGTQLNGFQFSTLAQAFNKSVSEEAIKLIGLLNNDIRGYEEDKAETENIKSELETEQANLIAVKNDLDNKRASAQGEFNELGEQEDKYEGELRDIQEDIENLTAKQQEILRLKSGDENGTVGDYDTPSHKTPDAPFKPAFAAFSYGAYTHYKGMSQYGAKGRADDGKSYKDILKFYYKQDTEEKDIGKICVEGYGKMDMDKYLYGLGEMPSDWPKEALKAQAVAARSYAYRYVKQDKCICTSQSCQVFIKSKSDSPPSRWKDAVDDTEDRVLKGDVVAYYSSTTGGYIENIGWDKDGEWPGDAYEKKAGSPWFYKAWYTKSYSSNDNCGRSHPWMTEKEMADILNALMVWEKGSSSERDRISPVTTSCWGGNPYSMDEMADKADKYGERYNKVTSIDVDISNGGYTSKVRLQTDKGSISVDGDDFKTVYNLRAPSYIAIRSRLYDFESKK